MSEDSKIISLSDHARQRKGVRPSAKPRTPKHGKRKPAEVDTPVADAAAADAASALTASSGPVPAKLVWLYCPVCETLEYTELLLPAGRIHQPCGTRVEEVEMAVDARAEYSLAELNLRQLERLAELVEGQRVRFREFQHRLELAAGQPLSSYPLTEDTVRVMPVAEVDPLGLLISAFLRQPLQRFRPDAASSTASSDAPPASPPGAVPPAEPAPPASPVPPPVAGGHPAAGPGDEPAP